MKKIIFLIITSFLFTNNLYSQSMIDLKTYVENNINDSSVLDYVSYRCAAAYTYAGRATKNENYQKKLVEFAVELHLYRTKVLMKQMNLTMDSAFQRVDDHINLIHQLYIKDGYEHHAKTGDYLAPYIKNDLINCKGLLAPIMDQIKEFNK